jgi:hypothetical protein
MVQTVGGRLVKNQQVGHRSLPEAVELEQRELECAREVAPFIRTEVVKPLRRFEWGDPRLVRVPRTDRYQRATAYAPEQSTLLSSRSSASRRVLHQTAPGAVEVLLLLLQLARGNGRDERIGVNLAVRVVQRDADLHSAVLEGKA